MAKLVLSRLDPSDTTRLRGIRLAALEESPTSFYGDVETERSWAREQWRQELTDHVWVIGSIGRGDVMCGKLHRREPNPHIMSVWVAPLWRRRQMAGILVRYLESVALAEGAERTTVWVFDGNARAHAITDAGYAWTGRRQLLEWAGHSRWEEEYVKELRPTSGTDRSGPAAGSPELS